MKLLKANIPADQPIEIQLPISKSFANRYFLLQHLAHQTLPSIEESWPDDVKLLIQLLNQNGKERFTGDAGTVMRFATAALASEEGPFILTGTSRMHERPIGILVEALEKLGAKIKYLDKAGFPPIEINGTKLSGGKLEVSAEISSQFISAIMMIGPLCANPLELHLTGKMVSAPYIELTASMMRQFGADVVVAGEVITVQSGEYKKFEGPIEADWSSAAYFYQAVALSDNLKVFLKELKQSDLQGDKQVVMLFENLGVRTTFKNGGVLLHKSDQQLPVSLDLDFAAIPDLVQPFVMTCAALGIQLELHGLYNLHLKETDRLDALEKNCAALNATFKSSGNKAELLTSVTSGLQGPLQSFGDHRMAMSLAPLVFYFDELEIPEPDLVHKSFPEYWNRLAQLGVESFL